jgi:hypothetical protein
MTLDEMRYSPLWSNWFYSYLDIPNLESIKKEIVDFLKTSKDKYEVNQIYSNYKSNVVLSSCPNLKQYLTDTGIIHKFNRMLVSRDINFEKRAKVHVDSYNPETTQHSLNIGLIDYEDSYTAWYKTDRIKLKDSSEFGLDPIKNYAYLFLEEAEEISRVDYNSKPLLVNTTILHKGISNKPTRVICGLRFYPELTESDILNLGVKNPHIQE